MATEHIELDPNKNFQSAFIQIEENKKYMCHIRDCVPEEQNKKVVRFYLTVKDPEGKVGFHNPYIEKSDDVDSQWFRFNAALFGKDVVFNETLERVHYINQQFQCTFKKLVLRGNKTVYPIFEVQDIEGNMIRLIG